MFPFYQLGGPYAEEGSRLMNLFHPANMFLGLSGNHRK
ncbi:hypothetical protein B4113_3361 [Geobacillus sp. B4113_201601]|nr:hypothetical protein B4113_3361 [Geobacillus sp. B4113_201601]